MNLSIVIPVHNDWPCLEILIREIGAVLNNPSDEVNVVIVNDASDVVYDKPKLPGHIKLTVIDLVKKVGHQRAIVVGLCYLSELENAKSKPDFIIVMDADGEDRPEDLPRLINAAKGCQSKKIIFASRDQRSEGVRFRLFYYLYRFVFFVLTGRSMRVGNFSCLPAHLLPRITNFGDFWNHYSGAVMKSNLPIEHLSSVRGQRYLGISQMDFTSLVSHGLMAISLFSDVIFIRFLKLTITVVLLSTTLLTIGWGIGNYFVPIEPGWIHSLLYISIPLIILLTLMTTLFMIGSDRQRNKNKLRPMQMYRKLIQIIMHDHG